MIFIKVIMLVVILACFAALILLCGLMIVDLIKRLRHKK